jgi:6-phosphogluconolactonase
MTAALVVVVKDASAVARDVAERFVASARDAIAAHGRFDVALAGGHTPAAMNELLAQEPFRSRVDWRNVCFFFGDERCVGPDHPDSNYGMTRRTLFAPLGIPDDHVFRMRGEDDPTEAARAYDAVIRSELGNDPRFDLVMLGMGPDGHTASLFPGTLATIPDAAYAAATWVEKLDTHRLTLTPRTINGARAVLIETAGTEKSAALAAATAPTGDVAQTPIRVVQPLDGSLTFVVDEAAAQR